MAYNVNDCVELRWGARETSEEPRPASVMRRQAARQVLEYRAWFNERRRPPRV